MICELYHTCPSRYVRLFPPKRSWVLVYRLIFSSPHIFLYQINQLWLSSQPLCYLFSVCSPSFPNEALKSTFVTKNRQGRLPPCDTVLKQTVWPRLCSLMCSLWIAGFGLPCDWNYLHDGKHGAHYNRLDLQPSKYQASLILGKSFSIGNGWNYAPRDILVALIDGCYPGEIMRRF